MRLAKSFGLTLPRQLQVQPEIQYIYSRLIFKLTIIVACECYKYPNDLWQKKGSPRLLWYDGMPHLQTLRGWLKWSFWHLPLSLVWKGSKGSRWRGRGELTNLLVHFSHGPGCVGLGLKLGARNLIPLSHVGGGNSTTTLASPPRVCIIQGGMADPDVVFITKVHKYSNTVCLKSEIIWENFLS